MFLIYSLNLETLDLKIYDTIPNIGAVPYLLKNIVLNFIRSEQGDRKAENAIKDDITDDKITEDGYFVRSSKEKNHQYDVYKRDTKFVAGRMWGYNISVTVKKVYKFGIVEASLDLPIESGSSWSPGGKSSGGEKVTQYDTQIRQDLMTELAQKLLERKPLVEKD